MKERYIQLMEKTLSAYTHEHIIRYFNTVKTDGLSEHGFARLTANMGILIAHGRRTDLTPLFFEMMDFCCSTMPHVQAANDFTIKEIIFCIMEWEEKRPEEKDRIEGWKKDLTEIDREKCYYRFARTPEDEVNNWGCFTMLSEFMRQYIGIADTADFVDLQIASQLKWIDENGMYREPNEHMVYDLVPRGLFAVLLHLGYNGKYRETLDEALRKSGLLTLKMQSVTGEIPYGGRSAQFLMNEAHLAIVMEHEANRYAASGNTKLAGQFKTGVRKALDNIASWLEKQPIRHIKNYFPTETRYGCETYAYFDKYMITTASFLYAAYLISNPAIAESDCEDLPPAAVQTAPHFHKLCLRSRQYFLEFDTEAVVQYDASGLGRVHKKGAPSAICLSAPCTVNPKYTLDEPNETCLSLCPGIRQNGAWIFAASPEVQHLIRHTEQNNETAQAEIDCIFPENEVVSARYTVSDDSVDIVLKGNGSVSQMLPAFAFDGTHSPEITSDAQSLTVLYQGYICRYATDGKISDTGMLSRNRNGHYRVFLAEGNETLSVKIEIKKAE